MVSQLPVFAVLLVTIPTSKIAFLKFILEGYDGLAVLSTVDRKVGLVSLRYFPSCRDELIALLESLQLSPASD